MPIEDGAGLKDAHKLLQSPVLGAKRVECFEIWFYEGENWEAQKEIQNLQEQGRGGLEFRLAKNNLEVLEQNEKDDLGFCSRSNWLAYSDNNTKKFHHHARQRRSKKLIEQLKNSHETLHEDPDEIDEISIQYFCSLFTSTTPAVDYGSTLGEVEFQSLSTEHHMAMAKEYVEENIEAAIWMMHLSKVPHGVR